MKTPVKYLAFIYFCITVCWCRKHNLEIRNDARRYITLSNFGFYNGGKLEVKLINFQTTSEDNWSTFGFSLVKMMDEGTNPYLDQNQHYCILEFEEKNLSNDTTVIYFRLDFRNKKLWVICKEGQIVHIYNYISQPPATSCRVLFDITTADIDGHPSYNASFTVAVKTLQEEGLYSLLFHSCPNYNPNIKTFVNFNIEIVEQNANSYLSAGDMPLPALYCMMSLLFFLSGMYWVSLLSESKYSVFKIHYMMTVLVFLNATSLALHGINYYYIGRLGVRLATWATLFYIARFLRETLLFVVLILIGTGWTYNKDIPRSKKLLIVMLPLQVLANVIEIMLQENEMGASEYVTWQNFFIFLDLLCCIGILYPVVRSIIHLRKALRADGKAAVNLREFKLYKHLCIIFVLYIYFVRIVVYLLKITLPFQYGWLYEMFREMAAYVFFIHVAYKFKPGPQNPYLALTDNENSDGDQVLTKSGVTEGLKKVNSKVFRVPVHQETLTEVAEEEIDALLGKESSHESN